MLIKWRGGGFIHPSEEGRRANPIGPRSLPTSINASSSSSSSVPSSQRRCGCSRKRGGSPQTTLRGKSSGFLFAQNSSEQLAALPSFPQTLLEGGERIQRGRGENSVIDHLFVLLRRRWRRTGGGYPPSLLTCHGSSLSLSLFFFSVFSSSSSNRRSRRGGEEECTLIIGVQSIKRRGKGRESPSPQWLFVLLLLRRRLRSSLLLLFGNCVCQGPLDGWKEARRIEEEEAATEEEEGSAARNDQKTKKILLLPHPLGL